MSGPIKTVPETLNSPWRKDFTMVAPTARRAARYALQMMARCPMLHRRLEDDDFLGALWTLTLPLIDPNILSRLQTEWSRPDTQSELDREEQDMKMSTPSPRRQIKTRAQAQLLDGLPGARMRAYLTLRFRAVSETLIERLLAADGKEPTHASVFVLAQSAKLDAIESALLDFAEKKGSVAGFREFLRETCSDAYRTHYQYLAAALDVPVRELQKRLNRRGALSTLKLLRKSRRQSDLEDFLNSECLLEDVLALEPDTPEALLEAIVTAAPAAECSITDFPHLAQDARRLISVIHQAAKSSATGVNALFYGVPGTGKTQFARAVAMAAGLSAYVVNTADQDGDGLSREGRLGAYQLTQRMLRGRSDCVIIFDEVEDAFGNAQNALLALFGGTPHANGEKGWMNQTLEENPVPAIWITNDADSMDAAFRRRFLLPVAFTTPPRSVRRQIAERHLGDTAVAPSLLDELSTDSALTPAQFSAARRLVDLYPGASPETVIRQGIAASRRLMHGSATARQRKSATNFDVAYLNLAGGIAPDRIADALARKGRGSLCFYGPPGTGKTEFAHVLADALDRELIVRASSDLVSPYVGQTEQNIARLFADLDTERTVLLLDEVDSFLRDRRLSRHSWETTQVNELLQQMEQFGGIFIAATNLMDQIDAAALRRFDFKLQFRPLEPAQRIGLFAREVLGDASRIAELTSPVIRKLESLEGLTPGDFANVVKQRDLLGEHLSAEDFLRRLIVECRHRAGMQAAA